MGHRPRFAVAVALVASLAAPVGAEAADDRKALERRVQELERQNAALLQRLDRLERTLPAAPAEEKASAAPPPPPAIAAEERVEPESVGLGLGATYGPVRASFQLFGDTGFAYDEPGDDGVHTSFVFGSFDAFATAKIGERFQALGELVFEGDSEDNEVGLDFERLWGSWTLDDRLYVKLGREHSPNNRWNRRYHHGRWLWTSATQPFLARFEDDGGLLPVHQIGLEAGGGFALAPGRLDYVAVVSNGRGRTPEEITNFADRNDEKAYDLGFSFAPARFEGFTLGANVYLDEIPPDNDVPSRRHSIREIIGSGFVEKALGRVELLGEYAFLAHKERGTHRNTPNQSGYLQAGYHVDDFTPYVRFDINDMASADPFFAQSGANVDRWETVLGVRYDLAEFAALTLEGGIGEKDDTDGSSRVVQRLLMQLSFVF
jgi:hypothetical protein